MTGAESNTKQLVESEVRCWLGLGNGCIQIQDIFRMKVTRAGWQVGTKLKKRRKHKDDLLNQMDGGVIRHQRLARSG